MVDDSADMGRINETLADNLIRLMESHKIASDAQLAALTHGAVDQKTVWRIKRKEQSPTIGKVEALAQAFGLQAWQLLVPNLDPKNPPVFTMTDTERNLYNRLNVLARELIAREPKNGE